MTNTAEPYSADTAQIGDEVIVTGRYRFARTVCRVVAIQRLRYRAMVEWPDGHRSWHPVRDLKVAQ